MHLGFFFCMCVCVFEDVKFEIATVNLQKYWLAWDKNVMNMCPDFIYFHSLTEPLQIP